MRNGLGSKYMPAYAHNAIKIADAAFAEWAQNPNGTVDLQQAFSDLIAAINVRVLNTISISISISMSSLLYLYIKLCTTPHICAAHLSNNHIH